MAYSDHIPFSPHAEAVAVTPSDTVSLARPSRRLYVGGAGNLSVVLCAPGQTAVSFINVPAGTTLDLAVSRVNATGTTATDIVALL